MSDNGLQLFDFIKIIFTNPTEYARLRDYEKNKFFFMTNRFCGIAYPVQAQAFNHIRVPQAKVLDYWHRSLRNIYTSVPSWMYTKGKKKDKKKESDDGPIEWPSDEAVRVYLDRTHTSKRQLADAVNMFGDSALDPVWKVEKLMAEKK